MIGAGLKMPVESITPAEAPEYFGWLANLAQIDLAASGALTRQQTGLEPHRAGPADRPAQHGLQRGLGLPP